MYGRANRSPIVTALYTNITSTTTIDTPAGPSTIQTQVRGNTNLKVFESTSIEVGYRFQASPNLRFDVEGFSTSAQDLAILTQGLNFLSPDPSLPSFLFMFENVNLEARQQGITFSMDYNSRRIQLKPFISWQKTDLLNYSPFLIRADSDPTGENNIDVQSDLTNYKATPSVYGGFYLNYQINSRFSTNINSYFFTNQELPHRVDTSPVIESAPARIKGKAIVNIKMLFTPVRQLSMFLNLRNLLAQRAFEYYYTDTIGTTVTVGFDYEF